MTKRLHFGNKNKYFVSNFSFGHKIWVFDVRNSGVFDHQAAVTSPLMPLI